MREGFKEGDFDAVTFEDITRPETTQPPADDLVRHVQWVANRMDERTLNSETLHPHALHKDIVALREAADRITALEAEMVELRAYMQQRSAKAIQLGEKLLEAEALAQRRDEALEQLGSRKPMGGRPFELKDRTEWWELLARIKYARAALNEPEETSG